MIMPGMQNPHCGTPCFTNAACTGCSEPSEADASPSTVRTLLPRACIASTRQLATGLPSMWTVQAPQSPVPHPSLAPVRPAVSRTVSSRVWYGWTRSSVSSPLSVNSRTIFAIALVRSVPAGRAAGGALEGGLQGAAGQDTGQMQAVLGRSALVRDRLRGADGQGSGLVQQLWRDLLSDQA